MSECQFCSLRQTCEESEVVFWIDAELLAEKVETLLGQHGVEIRRKDGFYVLPDDVLRLLDRELSRIELMNIRVARGDKRAMMAATSLAQYLELSRTSWFDEAIERDAFVTYFQPIVAAQDRRRVAFECLIRLEQPFRHGGEIMGAAVARGRVHVFDAYARKLAIRMGAGLHSPGEKLFINFMPSSIYDPEFCMRSTLKAMERTRLTPGDIVFEVVESEQVEDHAHLRRICEYYRSRGFGFALDDAGSGSNSLSMIPELHPDYVKLDKSLVHGAGDEMRRKALEKFIELAKFSGARLIAEGIETAEQATELAAMGVDYLQGYYFGKPQPAAHYRAAGLIALEQAVKAEEADRGAPHPTQSVS